jgi:hypothetical protein
MPIYRPLKVLVGIDPINPRKNFKNFYCPNFSLSTVESYAELAVGNRAIFRSESFCPR